jgi:hypothetical protein
MFPLLEALMFMEDSSDFRETGYELKAGQEAVAGDSHSERHSKDCQAEKSITVRMFSKQ